MFFRYEKYKNNILVARSFNIIYLSIYAFQGNLPNWFWREWYTWMKLFNVEIQFQHFILSSALIQPSCNWHGIILFWRVLNVQLLHKLPSVWTYASHSQGYIQNRISRNQNMYPLMQINLKFLFKSNGQWKYIVSIFYMHSA